MCRLLVYDTFVIEQKEQSHIDIQLPCTVNSAYFLSDNSHNCVLIGSTAFLVQAHYLINFYVTYKVSHNKNEIIRDKTMGIYITHCIAYREDFLGSNDRYNFKPRA